MDDSIVFNYLFKHLKYYIDDLVDRVMNDSETDPHYSAVTANNLIICYMQAQRKSDPSYSISTVKEYVLSCSYTEEDFDRFEAKRKKESTYYIGEQFTENPA